MYIRGFSQSGLATKSSISLAARCFFQPTGNLKMTTKNDALANWVEEVAALTKPDKIVWCDGSDAEYNAMIDQMLESGTLMRLNEETHPNCYLHRSDPSDVARVEHLTFVCSKSEEDAGPNNHWMDPVEAHAKLDTLFDGCMQGRTMYVIP